MKAALKSGALLIIAGLRARPSRDGAGLRLSGLMLSPTESRLSLDGLRSAVAVELIWRDRDFTKIAFRSATADLKPARADHMLPVSGQALPGL